VIRIVIALILWIILFIGCSEESIAPEHEDPIENPCQGNNPPVIESLPDTFVALGDTIWLYAVADDPDQDKVHFSGSCNNITWSQLQSGDLPGFGVDSQSGEFAFVPKSFDVPYRIFEVSASDSCGAFDSTVFTIQVLQ
jgi:hypothetical protein